MIDFNPETFNKMQGDEDTWTSPWTEFYDEGDTQLADLEEGYTPGEGGLGDTLAGYGWQAPSDFDAAGIENMSLDELINFFGTDSGLLDEGMVLPEQWTDQFIEDYGYMLNEFDMGELQDLTDQYEAQQQSVVSGYDTWYGSMDPETGEWGGARGVHEMQKANLEAKHGRDLGNLERQLEKGTKDFKRQKEEALSKSMQKARTTESKLGRAGIAVGGGEFGLSRQNVMGQIEDEFDLMSQEYDKLKTEVDLQMENLEETYQDSLDLANMEFDQTVSSQMSEVFDQLELMGTEYDQAYAGTVEDYWANMFQTFASITEGSLGSQVQYGGEYLSGQDVWSWEEGGYKYGTGTWEAQQD